jgi:hypothetical protein
MARPVPCILGIHRTLCLNPKEGIIGVNISCSQFLCIQSCKVDKTNDHSTISNPAEKPTHLERSPLTMSFVDK